MLYPFSQVSGPSGRKKCTDAGLLKTVVDLLDAAEPVQVKIISLIRICIITNSYFYPLSNKRILLAQKYVSTNYLLFIVLLLTG